MATPVPTASSAPLGVEPSRDGLGAHLTHGRGAPVVRVDLLNALPAELLEFIDRELPRSILVRTIPKSLSLAIAISFTPAPFTHADTTGPYTVNHHPYARTQLDVISKRESLDPPMARLLRDAVVRLTAPEHLALRHQVLDRLASWIDSPEGAPHRDEILEPLVKVALTSAQGHRIDTLAPHDGPQEPAVTYDDLALVSFALAVASIGSRHMPDLPEGVSADMRALVQAAPLYAVQACACAYDTVRALAGSAWQRHPAEPPKAWGQPMAATYGAFLQALHQPGFPCATVLERLQALAPSNGVAQQFILADLQNEVEHPGRELLALPSSPGWDSVLRFDGLFRSEHRWPQVEGHLDAVVQAYAAHPHYQENLIALLHSEQHPKVQARVEAVLDTMASAMGKGQFEPQDSTLLDHLGRRQLAKATLTLE